MAVTETIVGKFVNLRCANESDAEFTLDIRNDEKLTRFIPKVDGNLDTQKSWISGQRRKTDDYFFVIEDKCGTALGTISSYNIDFDNKKCESGRFLSYGNAMQNIEAMLLLYRFIFNSLKIEVICMDVDINNKKVLSIHRKFGVKFVGEYEMNNWISWRYNLHKYDFECVEEKISGLLNELI